MENEKMEKTKTSDITKIHFLRSDVFRNAKSSSALEICYSAVWKCFFSKMVNEPVKIWKIWKIDTYYWPNVMKFGMQVG